MTIATYTPIYCARSDGETEIRSKKYGRESNGPSSDQLDRVTNPDDFYEQLDHDHLLTIEWKRQLGAMLQRETRAQSQHPWFLMFFPENYRLYKHTKDGKEDSDTYLYGYPQGRKKRFRTAQEFFPHFLWLMEGKSEDYGDCACKNCAGDWVHKIEPLPGRGGFVPQAKDLTQVKRESLAQKKDPAAVKKDANLSSPKVVIPAKPPQQQSITTKPPVKTPTPTTTGSTGPARLPNQLTPTPLPSLKTKEQEIDGQFRRYIYRIGELVWFNRGTAWGLALVVKRDSIQDSQHPGAALRPRFLVQPLSHPMGHPEAKLMTTDDSMRPWLAWSAPGPTHRNLNGKTYSTVDWQAVLAGHFGQGDAEVDGSIFAAKQIDDSFSLSSQLSNNTLTTGERTYANLFLGGEKLWVGDPVRLRINQGHDVMVIHEIIEKLKPNSTNISLATVHVVGDIYRFFTVPFDPANARYLANPHLPARMRLDLEYRNSITAPAKRVHSYWKLMQNAARVTIADLKGRWYESSTLLPILRTQAVFSNDIQRGEITDVGEWINGRGDANSTAGKVGTRYRERLEAVGRAVPPGTKLGGPDDSGEGGIEPVAPVHATVDGNPIRPDTVSFAPRGDLSGNGFQSQQSGPRRPSGEGAPSYYAGSEKMGGT